MSDAVERHFEESRRVAASVEFLGAVRMDLESRRLLTQVGFPISELLCIRFQHIQGQRETVEEWSCSNSVRNRFRDHVVLSSQYDDLVLCFDELGDHSVEL